MIEKILERLSEKEKLHKNMINDKTGVLSAMDKCSHLHYAECFKEAKEIVQEVAKEYVGGWIPVTYHVATDEEREEMCLPHDIAYILDCPMPDDEQEIIVCNDRYVWTDTCMIDEGYSLDSGNDWCGDIVAWMPMPKKYEPKKQKGE